LFGIDVQRTDELEVAEMSAAFALAASAQVTRDDIASLLQKHGAAGIAGVLVGAVVRVARGADDADAGAPPDAVPPVAQHALGVIVGFAESPANAAQQLSSREAAAAAAQAGAEVVAAVPADAVITPATAVDVIKMTLIVELAEGKAAVGLRDVSNDALSAAELNIYTHRMAQRHPGADECPHLAAEALLLARRRLGRADGETTVAVVTTVAVRDLAALLPPAAAAPPVLVQQLQREKASLRLQIDARDQQIRQLHVGGQAGLEDARRAAEKSEKELRAKLAEQAGQLKAAAAEAKGKAAAFAMMEDHIRNLKKQLAAATAAAAAAPPGA
jgi:hypothetical protein